MRAELHELLGRIESGEATADSGESQTIEFKTDGRSAQDDLANIAEAATCLANAEGGTIVVGVADDQAGRAAFKGTRLDADRTRLRIYEITSPPLLAAVECIRWSDVQLLILDVPASTQVHSANQKMPTERIGKHCMPMSTDRVSIVTAQRTGRDWSAAGSGVVATAVDPVAMSSARSLLAGSVDVSRRRLADAADIDVLRALGLILPDQTLTNAGALLLSDAYRTTTLLSYTHRRTPAGQLTANEHISGPLVTAIQKVFDLITARLETTPVQVGRGQQLHIADLPEAAVREALINGITHREYFSTERTVVEHSVTQLRVTSPGGFVPGVNVNNVLTTSSRTRNPNLAEALRMLGLAETAGSGVDRMYAEMARVGHEPPRYTADPTMVEVTLLGGAPNTALARYVTTLPSDEAADADTMLILLTLLSKRTVTARELMPLLQKASVDEAQSVLARLSGESVGLLEPTRQTVRSAKPTYRLREDALVALGAAVTYRRRTTDQLDRKVIDLVNETDVINGRMVRILLDLDTVGASRVLSDLVERGILTKTSEATRGPSVTYGKGPAFPARSPSKMQKGVRKRSSRPEQLELPLKDIE